MKPPCNLPEGEQAAVLGMFTGILTPEEETAIRGLFPQYLFFRNECPDDGWNVSDPVRLCTCTACGKTFGAVRGNYARGKLHHEECNCPDCGARVEGIAVGKYRYDMPSLQSWMKTAVARATEGGALMIEAGDARRQFTWDDLTGTIDWYPKRRYYFGKGVAQEWEKRVLAWAWCGEERDIRWLPTATVTDAFRPNMMGSACYTGDYNVIGLEEALKASELRYCQIMDFYEYEYGAKLYELVTARWIVQYLGWYAHHPQIEMAVKLNMAEAVRELVEFGKPNTRLLDWSAADPAGFLRMSRADAKTFLRSGMGFADLKTMRSTAGKTPVGRYLPLCEQAGGQDNLQRISACVKIAKVRLDRGVRYIRGQMPQCARMAPPLTTIIRYWEDYLRMAAELGYDLTEPTVVMPKDLQGRHDAAAETLKFKANEAEQKKYRKRRKLLEKKYAFSMGGLSIFVPAGTDEIVQEGQTLHHCVGGYAPRHIAGSTTILFLRHTRRPERSFLTVEMYERRGRMEIAQIHGYRNEGYQYGKKGGTDPREKYAWFLEPWLGWVNDGSPRDKTGAPIIKESEDKSA